MGTLQLSLESIVCMTRTIRVTLSQNIGTATMHTSKNKLFHNLLFNVPRRYFPLYQESMTFKFLLQSNTEGSYEEADVSGISTLIFPGIQSVLSFLFILING